MDQPDTLQQIDEQQRGSDKLRATETIGMKKSTQHLRKMQTECFTMARIVLDN
jgi:hypothetical protein